MTVTTADDSNKLAKPPYYALFRRVLRRVVADWGSAFNGVAGAVTFFAAAVVDFLLLDDDTPGPDDGAFFAAAAAAFRVPAPECIVLAAVAEPAAADEIVLVALGLGSSSPVVACRNSFEGEVAAGVLLVVWA